MGGVAEPREDIFPVAVFADELQIAVGVQRHERRHGDHRARVLRLADGAAHTLDVGVRRGLRAVVGRRRVGDGLPVVVAVVAAVAEQDGRLAVAAGQVFVHRAQPVADCRAHFRVVFNLDAARGELRQVVIRAEMVAAAVEGDALHDRIAEQNEFFHTGFPLCARSGLCLYPV